MKKAFFSLLVLAAVASCIPAPAFCQSWGPWSASQDAPVLLTPADRERPPAKQEATAERGVAGTPFIWLLKAYQRFITPIDGDRCSMHPTCSQYSVQAIRKHGPLAGIIMTVDRLIHEADEQQRLLPVRVGNRYRYPDPVENNDFWWYDK